MCKYQNCSKSSANSFIVKLFDLSCVDIWLTLLPNLDCKNGEQLENKKLPDRHETLVPYWFNVGPPSPTLAQHYTNMESTSRAC